MTNIDQTKVDSACLPTNEIFFNPQIPINEVNIPPRSGTSDPSEASSLKIESIKPVKLNGRSYTKMAVGATALLAFSIFAYFTAESYCNQQMIEKNTKELKRAITSDIENFNWPSKYGSTGSSSNSGGACYGNKLTEITLDLSNLLYSNEREKDMQNAFQNIDEIIKINKPQYMLEGNSKITWNRHETKYEATLTMC